MTVLIGDTETDGFVGEATKLHCIQLGAADGDDSVIYRDAPGYPSIAEGCARIEAADQVVMHNGVGHDLFIMEQFCPGVLPLDKIADTLILSRLADPTSRHHSLEAWGKILGVLKGEFNGPYDEWTQEFHDYSVQDIHAGRALWHKLKHVMEWGPVVATEHRFQHAIKLQSLNGFRLDVPATEALACEFRGEIAELDVKLAEVFPPIDMEETFTPKASNGKLGYRKGVPFTKRWQEVFQPGSDDHLAKRLMMKGWKPRLMGKDGKPKMGADILEVMPYPEAKLALERRILGTKLAQCADGKTGWLKVVKPDSRVYGYVNTIGCAPGRCSHSAPNLANVNKKDTRMRGVWVPRVGWKLVGCDAEGLQARGFGHYVSRYDGGAFVDKLVNGDKKTRTDIHSANLTGLAQAQVILAPLDADDALWSKGRDASKRVLYATWFGAQDPKVGWTAKDGARNMGIPVPRVPDRELGKIARMALMRSIRGYEQLVADIQATAASRKFLKSPLGRHIPITSKHSALVYLLQGFEADVMKTALVIFMHNHGDLHGRLFALCANVHDEVQFEAHPDVADDLGKSFAACIKQAGELMNLRCPLAGAYSVGDSWEATH